MHQFKGFLGKDNVFTDFKFANIFYKLPIPISSQMKNVGNSWAKVGGGGK